MAHFDLSALLAGRLQRTDEPSEFDKTRPKIGGVVMGLVSSVDDPLHLGRVKVRLPWMSGEDETGWAPIAVPWAGSLMGSYFSPQVDDPVVVAFEHGSLDHPIVLGFLWSTTARPPQALPSLERRGLKSTSGHELQFCDQKGGGKVLLTSGLGAKLELDDTAPGKVTIANSDGTLQNTFDEDGITVEATEGDLTLKAPSGTISLEGDTVSITATGSASVDGGAQLDISADQVSIN